MKGQATLERGILYAVVLALAVIVVAGLYFFFSQTNLNGSFSITDIRINHLTSNTLNFSVVLGNKISNPSSLKFYINSINNYFSVAGMQMNITLMPNGEYQYSFKGNINSSTYNLLNNTSNKFVLASYQNTFNKEIFSDIAYPISSVSNTTANVNQITFYIFPATTDFGISINGYQTLIENGQTEDLGNGNYQITAVQTNPNSDYFFDNWESGVYSGYISISNSNNITANLNVRNANGYVILFLGQYGPINFTSNENNLINSQNIFQCGMPESRFCIDNSVRNLYYVFQENKSSFSFAYPPYFPTSNPYERLGFVGFNKNLYSCSLPSQNNVQTDQGISAFCTVNATYEPEYYITAKSSNASYGLVAIQLFNGTTTPYGAEESGWSEVNSTNVFYAKPSPYNLTSMKGYEFVSWNGTYNSTENPFYATIKGVTNETATFKQCQLYSLSVSSSNVSMGSVSPSGTSYYCAGSTVELKAFTNSGYEFTGWSGTYSSVDNPFNIVISGNTVETGNFATQPPPPPPPPSSGIYYIYGCVVNAADDCIASMNGTTYNIAVGNYNTTTSSSTNVQESTFPFPQNGKSNSTGVYFNVANKLVDSNSDTYTLQGIVGVGLCGSGGLTCSGSYTSYQEWFGGSSRTAEYLCTGAGCPTGSGSGGGGSAPRNWTYKLIFNSVKSSTGSQISGSSDISQEPGAYSASDINSNHPSLYPSTSSDLVFNEFYPYSSSYQYQFVKDSQKVVYGYFNGSSSSAVITYKYCWLNSTIGENITSIPDGSAYPKELVNDTPCANSSTQTPYAFGVQNDTVNAIYKLVPKSSFITIETIPVTSKEVLEMNLNGATKTKLGNSSYYNGVNTTIYKINYNKNGTQKFNITFIPNNPSALGYYYLSGMSSDGSSLTNGGWENHTNVPSYTFSNLNANDSYTFYVSFPIPVNITTDFMEGTTSFGSYFHWSTVPYNTNLTGFNKYDTNATQTVYAFAPLPSGFPSGGSVYPNTTYYIDEGVWSGSGIFNGTGGVIGNGGDPTTCFEEDPTLSYCLATAGSGYPNATYSNNNSYVSPYYRNYSHASLGVNTTEGFYFPNIEEALLHDIQAHYTSVTTDFKNLNIYKSQTFYLNYGFYIPDFIVYNDNYSGATGQVGNCPYFGTHYTPYTNIEEFLYNMTHINHVCTSSVAVETPSSILYDGGFLVTKPGQSLTINLPNSEQTLYSIDGIYSENPSYLSGFETTPTLFIENDTTLSPQPYTITVTGIPSLNEANAYGFFATIK